MAVAKYKDSNGNIKTLSNVNINLLNNIDNKVLVSTENATLSSSKDSTVNNKTRALVNKTTSVWVHAKELEGKVFNYMKNQGDEIVSYNKNYNTILYTDEHIVPIYSDSEVEKKSLTFFQGDGYDVVKNDLTIKLYVQCDISDTHNKNSWGILFAPNQSTDEEIIVGGTVIDNVINLHQNIRKASVQYDARFPEQIFNQHYILKARAYSIIEKDGVEEIIYSDVITVQL